MWRSVAQKGRVTRHPQALNFTINSSVKAIPIPACISPCSVHPDPACGRDVPSHIDFAGIVPKREIYWNPSSGGDVIPSVVWVVYMFPLHRDHPSDIVDTSCLLTCPSSSLNLVKDPYPYTQCHLQAPYPNLTDRGTSLLLLPNRPKRIYQVNRPRSNQRHTMISSRMGLNTSLRESWRGRMQW